MMTFQNLLSKYLVSEDTPAHNVSILIRKMENTCGNALMPCIYVNHGGGPLPLLGQQPVVSDFLSSYPRTVQNPSAVLG